MRRGVHTPISSLSELLPSWLAHAVASASGDIPCDVTEPSRAVKTADFIAAQATPSALRRNAALTSQKSRRGSSLRICSYNVHFMRDCAMEPNATRVLDVIDAIDADVVALQEVALPGDDVESADNSSKEGAAFAHAMKERGYAFVQFSPGFTSKHAGPCGNAIFSRRPFLHSQLLVLDPDRYGEARSAAVATFQLETTSTCTVASVHLDCWTESRDHFGIALGEFVRALEFEELHHSLREQSNLVACGDFNSASNLTPRGAIADALDASDARRSPHDFRHVLPLRREGSDGSDGDGDGDGTRRLTESMHVSTLGFVESVLGWTHAWQRAGVAPPLYSHWSGKLIDHCLLRNWRGDRRGDGAELTAGGSSCSSACVRSVGCYHTAASDHLPLVIDIDLTGDLLTSGGERASEGGGAANSRRTA